MATGDVMQSKTSAKAFDEDFWATTNINSEDAAIFYLHPATHDINNCGKKFSYIEANF